MQIGLVASGYTRITLSPKESEILGLVLANEAIGKLGRDENGMAQGALEVGLDEPFWGRGDITQEEALTLVVDFLKGLKGFDRAVGIGRHALGDTD